MSRKVDVKALVSHIIRGDGVDKCRICMGDTDDGQFFLGDPIEVDGDQTVILSELLKSITGIEMPPDSALPSCLCNRCTQSAIETFNMISFYKTALKCWENTLEFLEMVPYDIGKTGSKSLYLTLENNSILIVENRKKRKEKSNIHVDFTCPDCGKAFKNPRKFNSHLEHSYNQKCACHVCGAVFDRSSLVEHMKVAHNTHLFSCIKCAAVFDEKETYLDHMKTNHTPGKYTCNICNRNFNKQTAFNAHSNIHSMKKCPNCDSTFRNQSCYIHHVTTCCRLKESHPKTSRKRTVTISHPNGHRKVGLRGSVNSVCYCDHCGKRFSGKKFIAAHIQIVHLKSTHRPCARCGKSLAAAHMSTHMKQHEDTRLPCALCGLVLTSKLGYEQHQRLHSGERPYQCRHCPQTFSASSRRSLHTRREHGPGLQQRHGCDSCPARFRLPYQLKRHLDKVHSQPPQLLYECPVCAERFASCRGLVHHRRKHQRVREVDGTPGVEEVVT